MNKIEFEFPNHNRTSGAIFSDCGKYRYLLWRCWHQSNPKLCIIILNPSDEESLSDNPLIRRSVNLAYKWGYGGIALVSLFSYITSDQKILYDVKYPVGPLTNQYIEAAQSQCKDILFAWGLHGHFLERGRAIQEKYKQGVCFGLTSNFQPKLLLHSTLKTEAVNYQALINQTPHIDTISL